MNIMTRAISLAVAVVTIGTAVGSTAQADTNYSGALCNPSTSADAGRVSYTQWGVQNNASLPANVSCGAVINSANPVSGMVTWVYDRSISSNVCCTFMVQNFEGSVIQSNQQCSSGSTTFGQALAWQPVTAPYGYLVNMQCSIPGVTSSGLSHVVQYFVAN